ncbi:MAG: MCE family protein [Chromatiaceae bacterium]|nr:MCE family protein [Chromatiaceae bacterium]
MSETSDPSVSNALPEARVRARARLSVVWLIPLVALLSGAWLAWRTLSEQGPSITIRFENAAGIQAGKTKVRFKDVEVGQVTAIDVTPDLRGVLVTADLKQGTSDFLTEQTRFWVERPRVTASRVTGLETLLSGAYIAMDPVTEGRARRAFRGLEEPPLFTTAEPGKRFVLHASVLGSLNIGSPVYYRQIQVGQVVGYGLDADGRAVEIEIFVSAPHDALVSGATRFWNASGLDVSLDAEGIRVDTQSLLSLVVGGISFGQIETIDGDRRPAEDGQTFLLYRSREQAYARAYARKSRYLLFFDGSVRGLAVGAPVLLRGIQIGRVLDVQLQFNLDEGAFRIPVLIEVEPERIALRGEGERPEPDEMLERLVAQGLRAQLRIGSLLTGQLNIEFDFHPDLPPASIGHYGDYQVIPTLPGSLEAMATKLNAVLDQIAALPMEQIGDNLAATLASTRALVEAPEIARSLRDLEVSMDRLRSLSEQLDEALAPELLATLGEARGALASARSQLAEDSSLSVEIRRLMQEITSAARSVRALSDYLERHPEALLQGKGGPR